MEFLKFTETVKQGLADYFGEGADIMLTPVKKNNGVILNGVVIKEKDSYIAPTIYLEGFYEEYRKGKSLGETVLGS